MQVMEQLTYMLFRHWHDEVQSQEEMSASFGALIEPRFYPECKNPKGAQLQEPLLD